MRDPKAKVSYIFELDEYKDNTNMVLSLYPKLKAARLHPRNYPHTPTDYRHTDNPLRLVMEVCSSLLHSAKPSP